MKLPVIRYKHKKRLGKFDYLGLEGITIEEKSRLFINLVKDEGNVWILNTMINLISFNRATLTRKKLQAQQRDYLESIKFFCEIADFSIPWKNITRGLPKAKNCSGG